MRFKDKIVLVTGASKGIGRSTAIAFAKEGAVVIGNFFRSEKEAGGVLNQIQQYTQGMMIQADVSKEIEVGKLMKEVIHQYGRLDILVNNAGGYFDGDEWNGPSSVWEQTFQNNLFSMMLMSKYASETFFAQESGIIINIASRFAVGGHPEDIAYSASKAAMLSITQSYAKLLSPFGRVNVVSPGATKSGYWLNAGAGELENAIIHSPHKRLIDPLEIAKVILFLASDDAHMITGQNVLVDGGSGL